MIKSYISVVFFFVKIKKPGNMFYSWTYQVKLALNKRDKEAEITSVVCKKSSSNLWKENLEWLHGIHPDLLGKWIDVNILNVYMKIASSRSALCWLCSTSVTWHFTLRIERKYILEGPASWTMIHVYNKWFLLWQLYCEPIKCDEFSSLYQLS